jgi:hypothetical protein
MAGLYFGATEATVLAKVQNTSIDASVIQIDIPTEMQKSYDRIIGMMPTKMSDPIDNGRVRGHILVDSADDGQETIDPDQSVYQVTSAWHLFLNPPTCQLPVNNVTSEMVLGTDYTIVSGVTNFAIKPLASADCVIANYQTTWASNEGLGVLCDFLEEDVALTILNSIGIANNSDLLDNVNSRREALGTNLKKLQEGILTPRGIQALNLLQEVATNDESHNATVTKFSRS